MAYRLKHFWTKFEKMNHSGPSLGITPTATGNLTTKISNLYPLAFFDELLKNRASKPLEKL